MGTNTGNQLLLALFAVSALFGCQMHEPKTKRNSKTPPKQPVAATKRPAVKAAVDFGPGSILLAPSGRGMQVIDTTRSDCAADQEAMIGHAFTSGDAKFRVTKIGSPEDPQDPVGEYSPSDVLLYRPMRSDKDVSPTLTIYPPSSTTDVERAINWKPITTTDDLIPANALLRAAFRNAVSRKIPLKQVEFHQQVEGDFSGPADPANPDRLVVAKHDDPRCFYESDLERQRVPPRCDFRDSVWLLLIPNGNASKSAVIYTGQEFDAIGVTATYDLDGDEILEFQIVYGGNPNESGDSAGARIRDEKLTMTCVWH